MEPVRTCLGCRTRDTTSALLRVVARNGEVIADQSAVLPGRGAWVHPTIECVTTATTRKAFGRAFRTGGAMDVGSLLQAIDSSTTHHQSERSTAFSTDAVLLDEQADSELMSND